MKDYHVEFLIRSRFGEDDLFNLIMRAVEDFGEIDDPYIVEVMPWNKRNR